MIMTIVVVRLSSTAERIKVMKAIFHRSDRLVLERRASRTKLNPPFVSMISTTVMAPMRKKSVSLISPRCSRRMCEVTKFITASPEVFNSLA